MGRFDHLAERFAAPPDTTGTPPPASGGIAVTYAHAGFDGGARTPKKAAPTKTPFSNALVADALPALATFGLELTGEDRAFIRCRLERMAPEQRQNVGRFAANNWLRGR